MRDLKVSAIRLYVYFTSILILGQVHKALIIFFVTACKNFLKLCKIKYYNFCLFHSVQANFIAQTGDPTGIGTGGESVYG